MSVEPERAQLTLEVGGARFALRPGQRYQVGRGHDSDLRINHATVSEQHCVLQCTAEGVLIQDLGTQWGTAVEGQRIRRQVVKPGQRILFGAIEARLVAISATAIPPMSLPRVTIDPRLRFRETTFSELMAEKLRSAPWLSLSMLIHAIVLLLLFHFVRPPAGAEDSHLTITMLDEETNEFEPTEEAREKPVTEIVEETEVVDDLTVEDPFDEAADPSEFEASFEAELDVGPSGFDAGTHWLSKIQGKKAGILSEGTVSSGGFGKTVRDIRRSGLEIMFVFDSTGSMGSILRATKEKIAHMVEMMYELVPDARIGIVTYRDRARDEEYVTRGVPLSRDFYRTINFMQIIEAGGGGDRPEAVLDGLAAASNQNWQSRARRVVVLIGDAPAHDFDERKIKRMVETFVADGRSQVHAIVTSPYGRDSLEPDTKRSFRMIAGHGQGECIGFEDETQVLRQVLSLAFGREYRRNLDEVSSILEQRRDTIATFALDLLKRKDFAQLERRLREKPISGDIVKAMARSESKDLARFLVGVLAQHGMPAEGRHAAAYALSRMLERQLAFAIEPILENPLDEGVGSRRKAWQIRQISSREAKALRGLIDGL